MKTPSLIFSCLLYFAPLHAAFASAPAGCEEFLKSNSEFGIVFSALAKSKPVAITSNSTKDFFLQIARERMSATLTSERAYITELRAYRFIDERYASHDLKQIAKRILDNPTALPYMFISAWEHEESHFGSVGLSVPLSLEIHDGPQAWMSPALKSQSLEFKNGKTLEQMLAIEAQSFTELLNDPGLTRANPQSERLFQRLMAFYALNARYALIRSDLRPLGFSDEDVDQVQRFYFSSQSVLEAAFKQELLNSVPSLTRTTREPSPSPANN